MKKFLFLVHTELPSQSLLYLIKQKHVYNIKQILIYSVKFYKIQCGISSGVVFFCFSFNNKFLDAFYVVWSAFSGTSLFGPKSATTTVSTSVFSFPKPATTASAFGGFGKTTTSSQSFGGFGKTAASTGFGLGTVGFGSTAVSSTAASATAS